MITVDTNNSKYDSRNNCNAIINSSTNILIKGCDETIIPNDITIIGHHSFQNNVFMDHIDIPENIINI